ncbi:hypothetical protein CEUSTIGMA_g9973.t1 [Chlamydomonas eustigma]|uniref:Uncharacterized protein n=1 Tax=Chlamydomonas eustigma TaxID=1157962 RepID=A0A250XHJ2_9CHLO|nr:hypothetical protein CEUSTIGMA_g9973.t1 [Chlamydomonas eustigma]|eukprot:GAX82547.1 hypothetical protein CEUSTIGMA_g9973.t1 [Chlamydomonas eustigma]
MAKNKKKTSPSTTVNSEEAEKVAPSNDAPDVGDSVRIPQKDDEQSLTSGNMHNIDVTDLQRQLEAAKQEIAEMKAVVAQKDAEIEELKMKGCNSSEPTPSPAPSDNIDKLKERLQNLKREQAEADAAREQAWRQLKSVVAEISRLGAPETKVPSAATTPTGTIQAVS